MSPKDLFTRWEESVQHALAARLSSAEPQPDDLLQAAGLHVRTGILAGTTGNIRHLCLPH
jgi:hypothetical protein